MRIIKAYAVQMSYSVSSGEKMQAEKLILCFNKTEKLLKTANEYLNIMKTPFKDNPQIDEKEIMGARAAIRRFRDKSVENFNEFKKMSFNCVNLMQPFSSDMQTLKIMKSFISAVDDLENKVNKFTDSFNNLESKEFATNIVQSIEDIQKQCEEVEEIINDRLIEHIQTNILAKTWVDSVGDDLQVNIQKKTPLIMDLYNKREDQLNNAIKENKYIG